DRPYRAAEGTRSSPSERARAAATPAHPRRSATTSGATPSMVYPGAEVRPRPADAAVAIAASHGPSLPVAAGPLPTGLGGVLYLIRLLERLQLPGGWPDGGALAEYLGGWGVVEVLARGLLGAAHEGYRDDPIWMALTMLDGRRPGRRAGAGMQHRDAY